MVFLWNTYAAYDGNILRYDHKNFYINIQDVFQLIKNNT